MADARTKQVTKAKEDIETQAMAQELIYLERQLTENQEENALINARIAYVNKGDLTFFGSRDTENGFEIRFPPELQMRRR